MIGHSLIITTHNSSRNIKTYTTAIPLEELQTAVGGFIETVPYLSSITIDEIGPHKCVAFCNEEGKLIGLPLNVVATKMWADQLPEHFALNDALYGDVIFVWGDDEFMSAL